jgi:hypothetical protein
MTGRTYGVFARGVNGASITGANTLDVASIAYANPLYSLLQLSESSHLHSIDYALLTFDATVMTDAYGRIHAETVLKQAVRADGIRPDGSFGQHSGILYNGNYGMRTYFGHESC